MKIFDTKLAIIGAGISGVSCAITLLDNKFDDFYIFEANERIGGRCFTVPCEDGFLEMGAQFIHGQVGNPIYKIANENNLIPEIYQNIIAETDDPSKVNLVNDWNGVKIDEKLLNWAQFCLYKSYDLAREHSENEDKKNLGEFIYQNYIRLMREKLEPDFFNEPKNINLINSIYQWNFKWECMYNGCASMFDMSLIDFAKYQKLEGCQIIEFKNGYQSLFETLISVQRKKFDDRIKLNHELKNILICHKLKKYKIDKCEHCQFSDQENKIVLLFANDTVVLCDKVVCTMSLGYLKENFEKILKPNWFIPDEKKKAIKRMGFGTVNKIILIYDKPFWDENLEDIYPIWPTESTQKMFESLNHTNFDLPSRWSEDICTICPTLNQKNALIAWIAGNHYHESLTNDEIKRECTRVLRKFLARNDIPEPIDVLRSNWYSNKFFKGSYSFYAFDSDSDDIKQIAEPIHINKKNLVQFAGEATHENYYSTVHGAYLTGIREADRIIAELNNTSL
ncbi:spermine oxidase [Brachionus plicatilis]|uniref:Spermine oxidase n=1 Tax=Brachionus plicatilis TaxID=10195 RepID=A0A3M7QAT7_BRAPC|nr:spermine oxidase [Brachionus plicatilis]